MPEPNNVIKITIKLSIIPPMTSNSQIDVQLMDGLEYLKTITKNSVDLVLTDPPYCISRDTGMEKHKQLIDNIDNSGETTKTEEEWAAYKIKNGITTDDKKTKYIKYGTIYGKQYGVTTDFGKWDKEFSLEKLAVFVKEFYDKLRNGGTCIIFFDLWKISQLKELMEKVGFKQIRFLEWIKTNPQPLNSKVNYLTNCREIALLGVKKGKPTFNSSYDNAIYQYPLQGGKNRFHPTQKSLVLFEELIRKHSNENDVVLDTFLGGGTAAIASKKTNRRFKGCELEQKYYDKILPLIE
jgi:site-specific DNA-methyltransferase (adenine-specific)